MRPLGQPHKQSCIPFLLQGAGPSTSAAAAAVPNQAAAASMGRLPNHDGIVKTVYVLSGGNVKGVIQVANGAGVGQAINGTNGAIGGVDVGQAVIGADTHGAIFTTSGANSPSSLQLMASTSQGANGGGANGGGANGGGSLMETSQMAAPTLSAHFSGNEIMREVKLVCLIEVPFVSKMFGK